MTVRAVPRGLGGAVIGLLAAALLGAAPGTAAARARTVTLVEINDLHAHLTPHADLRPGTPRGTTPASATKVVVRGGVARIATMVKRIRAKRPATLVMNVGDTYHGGVEALYTDGDAIVEPVNALGIDVGVPGNWDFAYGPAVTRRRYVLGGPAGPRPNFPNLAANVTETSGPRRGRSFLPPTMMRDLGGVRVGLIGITSDIVPTMSPLLATGLSFLEGEAAYRDLIDGHAAALRRDGADVVVVMSELGTQKDYRLAQVIRPGVDVIFSAHTHDPIRKPLRGRSGAVVVQAGNDGYLGRMDITVNRGRVTARRWRLLEVTPRVPEDPHVRQLVERARRPFLQPNPVMKVPMPSSTQTLTEPIDTVVGRTEGALDRRHALESSFNVAFTDALRRAAGTTVALTPGFRMDSVIAAPGSTYEDRAVASGEITLEDIYRFFPVPYTLAVGRTTGTNLRAILEGTLTSVFSTDVFAQFGGWMEGVSGLEARLDLAAPDGGRITSLRLEDTGAAIQAADDLTVAGCSRPLDPADVLCGHDGFTGVRPLLDPATGSPWTPVDFLRDALRRGPLPSAGDGSLHDTSGVAVWPATPFVQPLEGVGG